MLWLKNHWTQRQGQARSIVRQENWVFLSLRELTRLDHLNRPPVPQELQEKEFFA